MKLFKITNNECTGCLACMNACEQKAIYTDFEAEGFFRPIIDYNKCVNCGMCKKVCPQNNELVGSSYNADIFAGFVKDENKRIKSTSGGIFYCIAENFLKNKDSIVVSVCFDDNLQAVFKIAKDSIELDKFRKSKYTQACPNMIYREINEYLKKGFNVLFAGMPCQVAAVKSLCDNAKLYCVDYVCHCVPSPKVWQLYCSQMESLEKSKLKNVDFRFGEGNWKWNDYAIKFYFTNGKNKEIKANECNYFRAFIDNYTCQNSCFSCKYKNPNSKADLTLGDFWMIEKNFPYFCKKYDINSGVSAISINNTKGFEIIESIKSYIILEKSNIESLVIGNPNFSNSVSKPENKDYYYNKIVNSKNVIKTINNVYAEIKFRKKIKRNYNKICKAIDKIISFFKRNK